MVVQMFKGKSSDAGVSSFQALSLTLSGRVGTGNIAGVATSIAFGGLEPFFGCGLWPYLGQPLLLLNVRWHKFIN
jgi:alanine or glycine:cation symporter, AGCS family